MTKQTIVIVWRDQRAWAFTYNQPLAALWAADGDAGDVARAHDYVATLPDHRVYCFDTDDMQWRVKACQAYIRDLPRKIST